MDSTGLPPDPITDDLTDDRAAELRADQTRRQSRTARRELLREAAVQAELATGHQEDTLEAARRNIFLRVGTIVVGFVVLGGGLVMMILPGPGILGIIAGLAILSTELAWAERLLEYVKKRSKIDELKKQPKWIQVLMWTLTASAVIASGVYFFILR